MYRGSTSQLDRHRVCNSMAEVNDEQPPGAGICAVRLPEPSCKAHNCTCISIDLLTVILPVEL